MPTPDRNSNGRLWTPLDIMREVAIYYADWRGVVITAVILSESGGLEWVRPMVIRQDPTHPAHLSTDRGLCQFNSHYWAELAPDKVAFDGVESIKLMCRVVKPRLGVWSLNKDALNWWHGYSTGAYIRHLSAANAAFRTISTEITQRGTD